MTGSWAGAMGHTQFIPTTFVAFAVDFDGDGQRNIWTSEADALGLGGELPPEVRLAIGHDLGLRGHCSRRLRHQEDRRAVARIVG